MDNSEQTTQTPTLQDQLLDLKDKGLTFTDCVNAFGVDRDEDPHAQAAAEIYGCDGELEFDDTLVVSNGDDPGAYVMCWRWVTDEEAGIASNEDDETGSSLGDSE